MFRAGYFGLNGVLEKPSIGSVRVPSIVFCVYQLMFAAITYVLPDRTTALA
jgi:Amt family ammonium transporter